MTKKNNDKGEKEIIKAKYTDGVDDEYVCLCLLLTNPKLNQLRD